MNYQFTGWFHGIVVEREIGRGHNQCLHQHHLPYLQFSVNNQYASWDWDWEEGLNADREGGGIGAPPIRGRSSLS